jgi:acyl transferase domain-containing protein
LNNAKTVFMFSGQGSHYLQMGRALFEKEPSFRKRMRALDEIVCDLSGKSVIAVIYADAHDPAAIFARTAITHPSIFMVEFALAELLIQKGIAPDLTLGSSVGCFAAAAVAGFIDVGDALTAVVRQASALEAFCEPGGMVAVLANPTMYGQSFLCEKSELAAVNFASHFVVAATAGRLAEIEASLRKQGLAHQRLPVAFAFHSRWIDQAKESFNSSMRSTRCTRGNLSMMCCDHVSILDALPEEYFWNVTRNKIRFHDAIEELERTGLHRYIDVGPAGTLATFLKYGLARTSKSTFHPILTPFGHDQKNLAMLLTSSAR